jgi:hypothetical protein
MKIFHVVGAILLLSFVTTANAALSFIDGNGNAVTGPGVLDNSKDAIYFSETIDGLGSGQYTVTNNTLEYGLIAFGISNNGTQAWIGSMGSTFGCGFNSSSNWCYMSDNLDASNWDSKGIDFDGNTGMDIFGSISNVLDSGDNILNLYLAIDGDLQSGDSWDQFLFSPMLASQMFVVLAGPSGMLYASGGQPINAVPVPAAAWLMMTGLVGLVGVARRRKA